MYFPWPTYVELVTAPPTPWARSLCDAGSQRHLDVCPLANICGAGNSTADTLGPFVVTLVLSVTWMYPPWPTYVELVTAPPTPWARLLCDAGSQRHLDVSPLADFAHMWSW